MLKKLFLALTFTAVSLFAMNFQTASKDELMTIKGIGEKRAASIIKYRKSNRIKSATDLKNIDGIGAEIADNAKRGIKNADKKVGKAKKTATRAKTTTKKKTATKDKVAKKTKSVKEKASKKTKKSKEKATKRVKKKAGDSTKRAEKKAKSKKSKAKKDSKKKVKK